MIDKNLYERYLAELRWLVQNQHVELTSLLDLHGDEDLIALRDEDLAQVAFDCISLDYKLSDLNEISRVFNLLEITMTDN